MPDKPLIDAAILEHVKDTLTTQLVGIRNGGQGGYALTFYDDKQELTNKAKELGFIYVFEAFDDEFYRATRDGYLAVRDKFSPSDQKTLDYLFAQDERDT